MRLLSASNTPANITIRTCRTHLPMNSALGDSHHIILSGRVLGVVFFPARTRERDDSDGAKSQPELILSRDDFPSDNDMAKCGLREFELDLEDPGYLGFLHYVEPDAAGYYDRTAELQHFLKFKYRRRLLSPTFKEERSDLERFGGREIHWYYPWTMKTPLAETRAQSWQRTSLPDTQKLVLSTKRQRRDVGVITMPVNLFLKLIYLASVTESLPDFGIDGSSGWTDPRYPPRRSTANSYI